MPGPPLKGHRGRWERGWPSYLLEPMSLSGTDIAPKRQKSVLAASGEIGGGVDVQNLILFTHNKQI